MRRVWVIEASGKRNAFAQALQDAGFDGDKVLATFGRLYDLPTDELGFDPLMLSSPDISSQIIWQPKRERQVLKLVDLLANADEVLIATDTDLEGELIADQVSGLCQLANKKRMSDLVLHRVSVSSITAEGIQASLKSKAKVNSNKVRAAKARRILDRLLGFTLHSAEDPWRLSIGRIVSPAVKSLRDDPAEAMVIRRKLDHGWSAIIRVNTRDAGLAGTLPGILHGLPQPKLAISFRENLSYEHKPLTGPESLKLCMRSLDAAPASIQKSIQDNYEKGRLSYPRSDSRTLDEVGLKWIERMAGKEAIDYDEDLARSRQAETLARSYDAHNAVMPTGSELPHSSIPTRFLSLDEQVLRVIGVHSMRVGERPELFTREHAFLDSGDPVSSKWTKTLGRWGKSLSIVRDVDSTGLVQDPLRHELSRAPNIAQASVSVWQHPAAQIVMERLMEIGLGRPSTLLGLAEKTFTTYLDKDGQVNGRGKIMIEKVMRRLPELLSQEAAQALEVAVCDVTVNSSIADRLSRAWEILKKNPILLGETDPVTVTTQVEELPENGDGGLSAGKSRELSTNLFDIY